MAILDGVAFAVTLSAFMWQAALSAALILTGKTPMDSANRSRQVAHARSLDHRAARPIFNRKRLTMAKKRTVPRPVPIIVALLCSAAHLRWYVSEHPVFGDMTDAQLGKKLKISGAYIGMIMSGARPPTKKFLKAIGWEAVTLYQMKSPHNPNTVRL